MGAACLLKGPGPLLAYRGNDAEYPIKRHNNHLYRGQLSMLTKKKGGQWTDTLRRSLFKAPMGLLKSRKVFGSYGWAEHPTRKSRLGSVREGPDDCRGGENPQVQFRAFVILYHPRKHRILCEIVVGASYHTKMITITHWPRPTPSQITSFQELPTGNYDWAQSARPLNLLHTWMLRYNVRNLWIHTQSSKQNR